MTARLRLRRNAEGERGAVLVVAAVGMVVAILAAAMAIDVGSVIWRKRDLQVVADMAATDTAQQLALLPGGPTQFAAEQLAQESADRNGFDVSTEGYLPLTVELGRFDLAGGFAPSVAADATAVRVEASRFVDYRFYPGGDGNTVTVEAIAAFADEAMAALSIGSKLASLDTRTSSVLGPVLSGMLGVDPSLNLGVVTYEGLASSHVTMGDLAAELGFGTVDEMLAGNVTVPQLADASAKILDREGTVDASVVTALLDIAARSSLTTQVAFGDMVDVEQGQGDAAASVGLNVLDLLTTAGQRVQIANGKTFLTVPLTVGIPGLASSSLRLDLIEPAVISAFGPIGTSAKTAQVKVTLNTQIGVNTPPLCVLFLCIPRLLQVDLPIVISAAGATGTISDIRCVVPEPESEVDISVATDAATATARATATLVGIGLDVADAGPIEIGGDVTNPPLTFPGADDPVPMVFPSAIQSTPGAQTLSTSLITDAQLSVVGLNAGSLLALVTPVTSLIDSVILNPVLDALGLSVGGADVRTLGVHCPGTSGRLVK